MFDRSEKSGSIIQAFTWLHILPTDPCKQTPWNLPTLFSFLFLFLHLICFIPHGNMQTSKPKLIWICSSCRLLGIYFTIQWNWIQIRNFNLVFRNYVASHYMAFNRVSVICSLVWIQIGRFLPPTQSHIPCYRRPTKRPPDQKVIKLPRKTALWPSGGDEEPGWRGSWKSSLWRGDEKVLYGTSSFLKPTKEDALRKLSARTSTSNGILTKVSNWIFLISNNIQNRIHVGNYTI